MKEELFISGRHLENIDPHLAVWHWPIAVYLFVGGLAAGLLFFAALFYLLKKEDQMPATTRIATIIAPIALIIGLLALFYDLTHKLYFWKLYTTIRLESPMSWGAWVLMLIVPLSMAWVFSYFNELFPALNKKLSFLNGLQQWFIKNRKYMAMLLLPLSIILGVYTGILLSAFNARPLWNNAILGPLFLISGLSTGAASIILVSKSHFEKNIIGKIDLGLIILELALITHMIMGYYAGTEAHIEAVQYLVGGEFTLMFFGFVVLLGLIVPALMESLELMGFKVPTAVPAVLVIIGGLVFRFVMVEAGQLTQYLY